MKVCLYVILYIFLISCETKVDCVEGDCKNGQGRFVYKDGITYEGSFKNGRRDGKGKIYSSRGTYYIGEWKNNQPHGYGQKYWGKDCPKREGEHYEGPWKNGKMHGFGTYYYKDGKAVFDLWKDGVQQPNDEIPPNDLPPKELIDSIQ